MNLGLTSIEFLLFLPIVCLIYYLIPRRIRQYYLLVINLLFYASFGYSALIVLFAETTIAWMIGCFLSKYENDKRGKSTIIVAIGILVLAVVLLLFRIGRLFSSNSFLAPLGISFYTLQAISYIVDVYKCKVAHEPNLIKLLTFLSFFPTITSGPIYRYNDFVSEYNQNLGSLKADYNRTVNGIIYLIYGYFLKLVIAERAAIPVNKVFGDFESVEYGGVILFVIAITYSVQIYADFAGYSAIVIGIAQILGYKVPENFVAPYLAKSIKEFWEKWHVSLSAWLRDYIYIPLGGNRCGKLRKYINILITFIVSGLWHGFHWHFIVWGGIHSFYQVIGDMTKSIRRKMLPSLGLIEDSVFYRTLQRIVTFILVTVAWIFFRTGLRSAIKYIVKMFCSANMRGVISGSLWNLGLSPFNWILLASSCLVVLLVDFVLYKENIRVDAAISNQGTLAKGLFVIAISLTILIFGIYGDQHDAGYFVYRDF